MTRFADVRVEWHVEQIERDISRKADSHEVYTLCSDVDSLERTCGVLSSVVDGLRNELATLQDQIRASQDQFGRIEAEVKV
jgi:predicted  nucleic acid-binding Zn-ribbon protein